MAKSTKTALRETIDEIDWLIEVGIKRVEKDAVDALSLPGHFAPALKSAAKNHAESEASSGFVRTLHSSVNELISRKYSSYLVFTFKPKWPTKWMLNDHRIKEKIKKDRVMINMLNHIHELNKTAPKGKEYTELLDLTNRATRGEKYRFESKSGTCHYYDYAVFRTDKDFYSKITDDLGYSKNYIQKYLKAFCDRKIFIRLGKTDKAHYLYADGYYKKNPSGKRVKYTFLKETTAFKEALRNFKVI